MTEGTGTNSPDKRIQRSKKAFKDALCLLCAKKDIAEITVSDIVDSSGYSRGAFYAQYSSKEDFLTSIVDEEVNVYVRAVTSLPWYCEDSDFSSDVDYILPMTTKLLHHVYENRELYKIMLNDQFFLQTVDYFCEKAHVEMCRKIKLKYYKSIPYDKSLIDFDLYYFIRVYDFFILLKYWMKNDFSFTPEYIAEQERLFNPNLASVSVNQEDK